jgi:methionyl-tRNA synthetase
MGNVYFDAKKPWTDAKEAATHARMRTTISCCLECLKALALISAPLIPTASESLFKLLGVTTPLREMRWDLVMATPLQQGENLEEPKILFQKVEDSVIQAQIEKLHSMANS